MIIKTNSPTASTLGRLSSEVTVGCSLDWPARNRDADGVRMTRIESRLEGYLDRAWIMFGSLMVATLPEQASRRWALPSLREAVRVSMDDLLARVWWASWWWEMAWSIVIRKLMVHFYYLEVGPCKGVINRPKRDGKYGMIQV